MALMKKFILILLFVVAVIAVISFGNKKTLVTSTNSKKLQIAASFYPMYFFAKQIGGDKADVFSITPASAEPHDYEPTTQDIARIAQSNMLVVNGGKLEAWGDKIKDQLKETQVVIVTAGEGIANQTLV